MVCFCFICSLSLLISHKVYCGNTWITLCKVCSEGTLLLVSTFIKASTLIPVRVEKFFLPSPSLSLIFLIFFPVLKVIFIAIGVSKLNPSNNNSLLSCLCGR